MRTVTGQQDLVIECAKLTAAIDCGSYREQRNKLFAARQALCWAINPESAASPYLAIMGSQGERVDCWDEPCLPQS